MHNWPKALIIGALTGVLGLLLIPFCLHLEEDLGLGMLFKLRGPRTPPSNVIIVSMDKASAEQLNVSTEPDKWPRSLHAKLIEKLVNEGAAVIVFDIIFDEARSSTEDIQFAEAIRHAGNVVLGELLKIDTLPLSDRGEIYRGHLVVEKTVPPIEILAQNALALAPFPLPKVPVRVSQYWTIKKEAGDTPTLPVVAFQIFALKAYDDFIQLFKKAAPHHADKVPHKQDTLIKTRRINQHIMFLREIFKNEPAIPGRILEALDEQGKSSIDNDKARILASVTKLYRDGHSRYLDFYGPPGTIETIPYYQVLQSRAQLNDGGGRPDFKGKAVFVGLSETLRPEQKDGFYTVFSQRSGLDISGVEIAATAFANLVEDRQVRPLGFGALAATVFVWGVVLGMLCILSSPVISIAGVIGLSSLYLAVSYYQFKLMGMWYPLTIPILIQAPLGLFGIILWKYFRTHKEGENIRKALGFYLPGKVVDQVVKDIKEISNEGQIVYGTCLYTDVEQYTKLSERMGNKELSAFMKKYYEAAFSPVREKQGIISDLKGDSMLALWPTSQSDISIRTQACLAALEISHAVNQSNGPSSAVYLPTRIGLHSGEILLGNIGAIDHYEYRPLGDIVNTVERIESLNKQVGTKILVSDEILLGLKSFLTREIGEWMLRGKSRPMVIHELICCLEEAEEKQFNLCECFAIALDAYKHGLWKEAIDGFHESAGFSKEDGPSKYFLALCKEYQEKPPKEPWHILFQGSK
jgi:adenylate cyclase